MPKKRMSAGCSNQTIVNSVFTSGFGAFLLGVTVLVIILFAILRGLGIFVLEDLWFYVLFGLLGLSIILFAIGYFILGRCIVGSAEPEEEKESKEEK